MNDDAAHAAPDRHAPAPPPSALPSARAARRFCGLWALWGGLTGVLTLLVLGAFLGWWPEATAAGAGSALWWAYALGWLPAWAALALWLRAARADLQAHAPALGRDPKAPLVSRVGWAESSKPSVSAVAAPRTLRRVRRGRLCEGSRAGGGFGGRVPRGEVGTRRVAPRR